MSSPESVYQEALASLNSRKFVQADKLLREFLRKHPKHIGALNLLTIALMSLERFSEAETFIAQATKLNQSSDVSFYNYGLILKRLNKPGQALEKFNSALGLNPNVPETWNNRGTVFNDLKQYEKALGDFDKAIALNPDYAEAFVNKGKTLKELNRHGEACAVFDKAIGLKPDFAEAHLGRGYVYTSLKRPNEAMADFAKALSLKPDLAEAQLGRGNVFNSLKRYDDAFVAYGSALSLQPGLAEAHVGFGNVFNNLKRYDDALAAYDRALSLKPDLAEAWIGRGNVFYYRKQLDEASVAYDKALSIQPESEALWLGKGNVSTDRNQYEEALHAYGKALSIKPDLEAAWLGLGNVFYLLKRSDEAFSAYDKALSIEPNLEGAWLGRGNMLFDLRRFADAFEAYDRCFALDPDLITVEGHRLYSKLNCCDWSNWEIEQENVLKSVRAGRCNSQPFVLLSLYALPKDQAQCADSWIKKNAHPTPYAGANADLSKPAMLRIGYLSTDFRTHPVGDLTVKLFESHARSRFETYAFSIGPNDKSELRQRIEKSFFKFFDLNNQSDADVVNAIKSSKVDILIDLVGHAQGARLSVLAQRPAPILAGYLGFAGTVGGNLLDYIIADSTVIPDRNISFYSEKIVRLPNCFMPHDDKARKIPDKLLTRKDQGLPEEGIVFCCFNNAHKINPAVFNSWMNILGQVEGSVIWLSNVNDVAKNNLKKEAEKRGIDSSRLIFATYLPSPADHLSRHRLADLFLDAQPYNAHTTASDALWAGLPVLTYAGETFAARVAASLLNTIDLPELITHSREEYEERAIEFALNREKLERVRQKLDRNRLTTPLFDTALLTKNLEAAYEEMHRRYRSGLPLDHIDIAEMTSRK